jgi:SAM-dependent methyltransferase
VVDPTLLKHKTGTVVNEKIKMVHRACPVCGSKDESRVFAEENINRQELGDYAFASRKMPEYMHYRLVVCPGCDLLYASPLPTLSALSEAYHEAAFDSAEEAGYAARTYGSFLKGIGSNLSDSLGAIDIGTGDGAFLEELLKHGFSKVVGVEPSKAPIQAAKKGIRPLIVHGLFKPKAFKKNSVSLVTCFQTLEHLYEPKEMCKGAYQILKPDGAFFVVSHNRRSLSATILGRKSPIFDVEHLQLFSRPSAKRMFEEAGFKRVEVRSLFNLYPVHYWLKLLPFPMVLKKALIPFLKKIGIGYLPIPLPAGNMAVIGYK